MVLQVILLQLLIVSMIVPEMLHFLSITCYAQPKASI